MSFSHLKARFVDELRQMMPRLQTSGSFWKPIAFSPLSSSTDSVRIDSIEFRIQDKKILGLRAASSFLSKVYNLKSEFKFIGI